METGEAAINTLSKLVREKKRKAKGMEMGKNWGE